MRRRQIYYLCALITLSIAQPCLSADGYNYGKTWLSWSTNTRLIWVWGFTEGQSTILEEIDSNQKGKSTFKFDISKSNAEVIGEIMTKLYEDPANTYIPWKYMTSVADVKLRGVSSKEIESQLQLLRQYADYERAKLEKK